jgi:RNA polymerase sigma-70 factor (ECF subfamily)
MRRSALALGPGTYDASGMSTGQRMLSVLDRLRRRPPGDAELVQALRAGDERAFERLVARHSPSLLRVARMYVPSAAVAEEVVQETWIGVLNGIDGFEARSSLRTWVFRIMINVAKTRGQREARSIPFSSVAGAAPGEPSVDPDRFLGADDPANPNGWSLGPTSWPTPERKLLEGETLRVILGAIDLLPPAQREVISLRDVEGWTSQEVCNALDLTETNQRVLLHRARTKVRAALERHFDAMEPTGDTG